MSKQNFTTRIKSLSVKTTKQVKQAQALEVNPPEIVFKDIELNQIYEITVEIRNLSKRAVRIRIQKPTNPYFKIEYNLQEKIAPELTMLAKIKYESAVLKNQNEKILIAIDDGGRLELPIRVYTMQSHLLFEPFVNMGFIKVGKVKEERIAFKNEGKTKGEVSFTHSHNPYLVISPASLTIEPGRIEYLNVKYKSDEPGLFKGEIYLKSQSVLLKNTIEIHATTVEFSRFFIDSHGQQQTMFDFGDMYVGQFSQMTAYLINNSPKSVSFKTIIRNGLKISLQEFKLVQSPAELGHEQNEKIIFCEPNHGEVKSFSQIKIKLICKSRISYKDQIYTKNYALTPSGQEVNYAQSDLEASFKPSTSHEYSIMFQFDDNDPVIVQMKGSTHCPLVKLEKNLFKFGDCPSHQQKEVKFKVKNVIPNRKVTLFFPKIPNFSIEPNKTSLELKKEIQLTAIFEPKNIGKFDTTQALIVNEFYEIPLRFFGISSTAGKKQENKDSLTNRSHINPLETETRKKAFSLTAERSFVNKIKTLDVPQEKMLQLSGHFSNKLRFDMVLKQGRQARIQSQKQKQVKQKWQIYTNKLKELGIDKKYNDQLDEQGIPSAPPIDYEFETGMIDAKINQQRIDIPKNNQQLFVTKHIGSYNPPDKKRTKSKYEPDQDVAPKKYKTLKPQNYKQQRQITSELTSDELELIDVGPLSIHFGDLYTKCSTAKYFWVRNSTIKSIIVRLQSNKSELSKSNFTPQIIPSCSQAGFEIILCKDTVGDVSTTIKYIINQKYTFEISIFGKITPVSLELSESHLKYHFDESNLEMSMSKRVILNNNGNGKAFFKFLLAKQRLFVPNILQGVLEPKTVLAVMIKFTAPPINILKAEYIYNEKLTIKVLDGIQTSVSCSAFIPQSRVHINPQTFDFGNVCIGRQIIKTLLFNNNISKYGTVAHIDSEGYSGIQCSGKLMIPSESTQQRQVKFNADVEGQMLAKINIKIRGAKPKIIECRAKVIKPNLVFEKVIDFDNMVVMGQPGVKKFIVTNPSDVEVPLIIDLRQQEELEQSQGIKCIELKILNKDVKLELYKDKPIEHSIESSNMLDDLELDDDQQSDAEDSPTEQISKHQTEQQIKRFLLTMKPKVNYQFELKFKAQRAINYQFKLPFEIRNYGQIPCPTIKAVGIEPKFIFDPQIIDFKKKIITTPDKCYPKYIEVTVSNPDTQLVSWDLDLTEFNKQQVFSISHKDGKIEAGEKTKIRISFNPFEVGEFKYVIPLFLESSTMKRSKYLDIEIKGMSSFPKLLFSKRQVILPVVPLNTLAQTSFNVLNDGYQNASMKYQLVDDVANLNLKLNFPDGNTLGLTRHKFKCEVGFKYPKPISFSIKLEFVDEYNRSYFITISGSTDNCLFTNYGFFLRNEGRFRIKIAQSLNVYEIEDQVRVRKTSAASMKSGTTNKSLRSLVSYIGSNMIKPGLLEETISYLTRFLNSNVLTMKIEEFPRSLIESDGVQLFQIINFFTTKGNNFPWKCNVKERGIPKVKALYNQYCEFIKMLKIEGAQLNHIRPQYLLSFSDLNVYLQDVLTPEQKKCMGTNLTRVNPTLFNYLSMDSWINLLYQIFRIYFLFRLTAKSYKSHISNNDEGKQISDIPKGYLDGSNFLSASEGIIIHWVESNVAEILLEERRITNFERDFKDGVVIAVLLQKYTGSGVLKTLKNPCVLDDDFRHNAQQICKALDQIGLGCHLIPKDIYNPLQRQILLFLVHLYHYLPYYTPHGPPIQFSCVLGQQVVRTIQLTNPSAKPVNYIAKYQGSEDFILMGEKQFRIQPKKTHHFEVKFISRVSVPVNGKISFVNKKENSIVAAAVVFNLQSSITGKISDKIWNICGALYDQIDFPIDIVNKFQGSQVAQFNVTIQTEYIYQNTKKTKHSVYKPINKQSQLPTIFSKFDIIRLRKNIPTQFNLSFIPTSMYTTKSTIIFSNFQVGEFQHEIIATVDVPPVIADIRPPLTLSVDQTANYEYSLVFRNQGLMKARKAVEVFKKLSTNKRSTPKDVLVKKNTIEQPLATILYVDMPPNPYISSKSQILLNDKKDTSKRKEDDKEVIQLENKLPLSYNCKNPVLDYSIIVTLMNAEKTDVRRYRLLMTVQPKPLKAILEMTTSARSELTQSLPIVNNTERDWVIKVVWEPNVMKNGHYFTIPEQFKKQFNVKKQSVGNFPVTFKPKWIQKAEARLILSNAITMDQFEYQIRGIGQEPLQEQHFDFECKTKDIAHREIIIKNPYQQKSITFKIETDLMNCTVPSQITIQPNGKQRVVFSVQPVLSGQYTGSIIFTEQNGDQYMWYTVTVTTNQPVSSGTITMQGKIRGLVVHPIEIENITNSDYVYDVAIIGEDLYGEESLIVKANSKSKYELSYLPLKEGQQEGTICFVNPKQGEILYQILMKGQQTSVQHIKCICSLGSSFQYTIHLHNPSSVEAFITATNTNFNCFDTQFKQFKLSPGDTQSLKLFYTPSSLDSTERAEIEFASQEIGKWRYSLEGNGTPPVPTEPQTIYTTLFNEKSNIILFKNPFNYPISMGISIQFTSPNSNQVFKLLIKSKVQHVEPRQYLEIPYSFIPTACRRYSCKITATINSQLKWSFPIIGISQVLCGKLASFRTKCREKQQQSVQISMKQAINFGSGYQYTYKLENIPKYAEILVNKFFTINQNNTVLNNADEQLDFDIYFKPLKPCSFAFDLVIEQKTGPRWRYKISLQATQPDVDDIIEIESPLLVTTSVAFKLANRVKSEAEFTAKFTSDSANQFSVEPKEGILPPYNQDGKKFVISFTPIEYGKEKRGKLKIETDSMYWSYLLKGNLPKYNPPKGESEIVARGESRVKSISVQNKSISKN